MAVHKIVNNHIENECMLNMSDSFKGLFVQYTQKDAICISKWVKTLIQTLIQMKPQFKELFKLFLNRTLN